MQKWPPNVQKRGIWTVFPALERHFNADFAQLSTAAIKCTNTGGVKVYHP
jgi:hypothetical protein